MQTRGVFPELAEPFSTPATPAVAAPSTAPDLLAQLPLNVLQRSLLEKDAEIARLQQLIFNLRQQRGALEVALINSLSTRESQA